MENSVAKSRTKYNPIDDEKRQRIICNYQKNMTIKEISNYESLPISTVYKIITKFRNTNVIVKSQRGGKTYEKITPQIKEFIQNEVDDNCTITLKKLKKLVLLKFQVTICEATIHNNLKAMHYSLKMLKLIPERRNNANTIEMRKQYAIEFEKITDNYPDTNIFFIDEVGFNVSMRTNKGRAKIGKTPVLTVRNIRSKNISVCCAIARSGIFHYEINHNAYNTISFTGYISNLFGKIASLNLGLCVIIMDNVPFHKSSVVKDRFTEEGHEIKYIPPYSPMLNPVENAFSKWKMYVKRENCQTEDELLKAMDYGMETITRDDCEGWYRNMKRYIRVSLEGIEIND